ncbi:hypothetical protein AcV5_006769 [Taiwanofungus camphoratus]|nr:hypothetical protein AcV5_006769 [Antrodia cinnamomea]
MPKSSSDEPKPILIVIMGVAGTGKTTLAKSLSATLRLPYIEGDELHPPANIEKMSAGQPLADADREPWLALLRITAEHLVAEQLKEGCAFPDPASIAPTKLHSADDAATSAPTTTTSDSGLAAATNGSTSGAHPGHGQEDAPRQRAGVLVTCSALRKYYREILRGNLRPSLPEPLHAEQPARPAALPTYFVYIKGERSLLLERVQRRQGHYMKANMVDSQLQTLENPEDEEGVIIVGMEETTEEQAKTVLEGLKKMAGPL